MTAGVDRSALKSVKTAKKRCVSMGVFSAWMPEYDRHPLAACISNYTCCMDVELEGNAPDYLAALGFIAAMARRINAYCDGCLVAGDAVAQYWLECFLWCCDSVVQWDCLPAGHLTDKGFANEAV